jgi:DUF971 family protein
MGDPTPQRIDIDRQERIALAWPDGISHTFELAEVRTNCPCAECRGLRDRGATIWPNDHSTSALAIASAEQVGAWGISLTWNDGHATGIYTWELLRAWALESQGIVEE